MGCLGSFRKGDPEKNICWEGGGEYLQKENKHRTNWRIRSAIHNGYGKVLKEWNNFKKWIIKKNMSCPKSFRK